MCSHQFLNTISQKLLLTGKMFICLRQEYARKALDFLWEKRQRSSNLVGVTINIHTGDWVRKGMKLLNCIFLATCSDEKYLVDFCGDRLTGWLGIHLSERSRIFIKLLLSK